MAGKIILVADPVVERGAENARYLETLGARLVCVVDGKQALALIDTTDPDLILCDANVGGHSARELCEYVHHFVAGQVPFLLVLPEGTQEADRIGREMGADGTLVRPLGESWLSRICAMYLDCSELRNRLRHLEEENHQLRQSVRGSLHLDPETQFYRFDLFKHVILMEVKKARRYNFPLSMLLMAIDNYAELAGWLSPERRHSLFGVLRKVLVNDIRDIDIPLLFGDERIMVVMPHTDLKSATLVADRIRNKIAAIHPPKSLANLHLSVSIAVSTTGKEDEVSFGKMVKRAVAGLLEAKVKGGDVVIICRPQGSEGTAPEGETAAGGQMGPRTFFL